MSRRVAPLRLLRTLVVLALMVPAIGAVALPALAVEDEGGAPATEHGPAPGIDEIGTQNEVSSQYLPEPAEAPPFMRFFYVPLIIAGFLVIGLLLLMYLAWQPRFAEERRRKRR